MRVPLKLSSIDREHLQELYDSAGIPRDHLPYTEKFDEIWSGFQDRTFKNAEREQVFGALIKYSRSGSHPAPEDTFSPDVTDDHLKQIKSLLPRHSKAGKILPYSDEFEAVRSEFNKAAGMQLSERDFWQAILRSQGPKRKPPKRAKVAEPAVDADDDGE